MEVQNDLRDLPHKQLNLNYSSNDVHWNPKDGETEEGEKEEKREEKGGKEGGIEGRRKEKPKNVYCKLVCLT